MAGLKAEFERGEQRKGRLALSDTIVALVCDHSLPNMSGYALYCHQAT